jgi:hypothetical protein
METASRSQHPLRMVGGTIAFRDRRVPAHVAPCWVGTRPTRIGRSPAIKPEASSTGASMAYEYRVTEAEDGTFPVELWSSQGGREQLIFKTAGFQNRELAEAWIIPAPLRSIDQLTQARCVVVYRKPRRARVSVPNPLLPLASPPGAAGFLKSLRPILRRMR